MDGWVNLAQVIFGIGYKSIKLVCRKHWLFGKVGWQLHVRICSWVFWTPKFIDFNQYSAFYHILPILLLQIKLGGIRCHCDFGFWFWFHESTKLDLYCGNQVSRTMNQFFSKLKFMSLNNFSSFQQWAINPGSFNFININRNYNWPVACRFARCSPTLAGHMHFL